MKQTEMGRALGLGLAVILVLAGLTLTLGAARIVTLDGAAGGFLWMTLGAGGLALGALGILALFSWVNTERARRRARH